MPSAIQKKSKACDIKRISGVAALFGLWMLGAALPVHSADGDGSLGFAPVRVGYSTGGDIDYLLKYNEANQSGYLEQIYGFTVKVGVNAETFVWQPWLLQLGSNVGLSLSKRMQYRSANNSLKLARTGQGQHRGVAGGATFRLLPYSRFPFIAKFTRNDSRREIGLRSTVTKELVDQIDIAQSYRTPRGGGYIVANYKRDRRENERSQVGHLESLRIEGSLLILGGQTLDISSTRSTEDSEILNRSEVSDTLSAQHTYRSGGVTLGTMAIRQDFRPGSKLLQYSTVGLWRPLGSRLTVNGAVRLYEQSDALSSAKNGFTGANIGANYSVNKWLRLSGSANIFDRDGAQSVSSSTIGSLSAVAQHHFETLNLWDLNYTRYVTANISNSSQLSNDSTTNSSSSNNTQAVSMRLQHGLNGKDIFSIGGAITSSQDVYVVTTSGRSPTVQVNHAATFVKRIRKSAIRLSARETRDITGNKMFFQSVVMQGRQQESLSGSSTVAGNMTVRGVRSGYDAGPGSTKTSLTSSASLSYRELRTFGVRNMIFNSHLRVISSELSGRQGGLSQSTNQGQYLWDNRLKYKIGKLQFEAQALWEEVRSSNIVRLLFHARREF